MTDATPAYSGPERILSGMQPTGGLHLGNYLGALKNWVPMQDSGKECFFCAVDMLKVPRHLRHLLHQVATLFLCRCCLF